VVGKGVINSPKIENRTFAHNAAKQEKEPNLAISTLCCVRTQNKYLCNRSVRPAASQQKKRSFVLGVPRKRGQGLLPTHSSDKVAQGHKG